MVILMMMMMMMRMRMRMYSSSYLAIFGFEVVRRPNLEMFPPEDVEKGLYGTLGGDIIPVLPVVLSLLC